MDSAKPSIPGKNIIQIEVKALRHTAMVGQRGIPK